MNTLPNPAKYQTPDEVRETLGLHITEIKSFMFNRGMVGGSDDYYLEAFQLSLLSYTDIVKLYAFRGITEPYEKVLDLHDVQKDARALMSRHDWSSNPRDRLGRIFEEVAEAQKEERLGTKETVGDELHDIIWNVAELANQLGIDLNEAYKQKQEKNAERRWGNCPCEFCKGEEGKA